MSSLDNLEFVKPADIEAHSFQMISDELAQAGIVLDPENELVVKRVIHTSADFEYAENLVFSQHATTLGVDALKGGCSIVTDTKMAAAGINKRVLGKFGGTVHNFISDADVAAEAKERGLTRSAVCMERAAALGEPLVYAVGNAPTALVRLYEMLQAGQMECPPALIIGVPVGFVNVVESKELICELDVPHIVARGRKGGSNVAAAICNALLYLASGNVRE
ncbi:MAG: precorrin-8X methylmutase [Eggerthellaceae bacterium]|nr:precorrin-8X methylmutase [Eggerthellaceae bacterium]